MNRMDSQKLRLAQMGGLWRTRRRCLEWRVI